MNYIAEGIYRPYYINSRAHPEDLLPDKLQNKVQYNVYNGYTMTLLRDVPSYLELEIVILYRPRRGGET